MVYSSKQKIVKIFKYGVQESGLNNKYKFEEISLSTVFKYTVWTRSKQINFK